MRIDDNESYEAIFSTYDNCFNISRLFLCFSELDDLQKLFTDIQTMPMAEVNRFISDSYHYIRDLFKYNDSRRTLRSSNNRLLDKPRANLKTYSERAFSVAAPRLWNKLPLQIRLSSSEAVFKANLKTFLFKRAFDL